MFYVSIKITLICRAKLVMTNSGHKAGEINVGPCSNHRTTRPESPKVQRAHDTSDRFDDPMIRSGRCISSCALPPPAPSPPLDLISMDLFEPIECLPMGPQITAVDNVHQPPGSDDFDIFIGSFEESIPLSDSD
ncbi:hypothetical protein RR48_09398 [Papilio machaon]|uniref:Uncharacterized protein n=1 Tax=Papilio machaon TaxID=76193 RepID=A0A194RDC7_PAPMA|nr:hypothetical protein RR48_09398 [Papilio machaon]